jgi:heme ABC exporter ATP-binding subunit CcmA/heme exporter protein CcmB
MQPTDTLLHIQGLSKRYQFRRVFAGFDLELARGEWVLICGPNGAGKSTLLRLIAGLEKAQGGSIASAAARVGYLSHASGLYEDLSPRENLEFFARIFRLKNGPQRAAELLKEFGLTERRDDPVRSLSRGMIRRLSIALAVLHQPDLLLLDEPFSGLDYDAQLALLDLLKGIQAQGCTIVLTTHEFSLEEALDFRLLYLYKGKLIHDRRCRALAEARDIYQSAMRAGQSQPQKTNPPAGRTAQTRLDTPPSRPPYRLRDYLAQVWAVAQKDLRTEMRTRELLNFMLLFGLSAILIFSFAFNLMSNAVRDLIPGMLWTALTFTGFLGLSKAVNRDFANQSMDVLRVAPIEPSAIYLGKLLGIFIVQLAVAFVLLLAALVLFNSALLQPAMIVALSSGILGLAATGTLLATLVERTRSREMLLPVLLMPVLIPLLIACVQVTQDAAAGLALAESLAWYRLIFIYNIIMVSVGMLTYGSAIEN